MLHTIRLRVRWLDKTVYVHNSATVCHQLRTEASAQDSHTANLSQPTSSCKQAIASATTIARTWATHTTWSTAMWRMQMEISSQYPTTTQELKRQRYLRFSSQLSGQLSVTHCWRISVCFLTGIWMATKSFTWATTWPTTTRMWIPTTTSTFRFVGTLTSSHLQSVYRWFHRASTWSRTTWVYLSIQLVTSSASLLHSSSVTDSTVRTSWTSHTVWTWISQVSRTWSTSWMTVTQWTSAWVTQSWRTHSTTTSHSVGTTT